MKMNKITKEERNCDEGSREKRAASIHSESWDGKLLMDLKLICFESRRNNCWRSFVTQCEWDSIEKAIRETFACRTGKNRLECNWRAKFTKQKRFLIKLKSSELIRVRIWFVEVRFGSNALLTTWKRRPKRELQETFATETVGRCGLKTQKIESFGVDREVIKVGALSPEIDLVVIYERWDSLHLSLSLTLFSSHEVNRFHVFKLYR